MRMTIKLKTSIKLTLKIDKYNDYDYRAAANIYTFCFLSQVVYVYAYMMMLMMMMIIERTYDYEAMILTFKS